MKSVFDEGERVSASRYLNTEFSFIELNVGTVTVNNDLGRREITDIVRNPSREIQRIDGNKKNSEASNQSETALDYVGLQQLETRGKETVKGQTPLRSKSSDKLRRTPSRDGEQRSPSPSRRNGDSRSPSPSRRNGDSRPPSPSHRNGDSRSPSPSRRNSESRSPLPSSSPKRDRRRSSGSPRRHRSGGVTSPGRTRLPPGTPGAPPGNPRTPGSPGSPGSPGDVTGTGMTSGTQSPINSGELTPGRREMTPERAAAISKLREQMGFAESRKYVSPTRMNWVSPTASDAEDDKPSTDGGATTPQ